MQSKRILLARLNLANNERTKHPSHCTPPYPLKYIQSLLKEAEHDNVRILDALPGRLNNKDLIDHTLSWKPDIVILQVNATTLKQTQKYLSVINKSGSVFTIAVGSIMSKHIPRGLDVYLPGEGEIEAFELIMRLTRGDSTTDEEKARYQNFKLDDSRRLYVQDLDRLPFPEYTSDEIADYRFIYPVRISEKLLWGHILSSRGCPYPCSFCSPVTRESYGTKVRLRSPQNIVDEMERLRDGGFNVLSFDDDLFTISRKHIEGVCAEIARRRLKIKWIAHSRVDNVDYQTLKTMKEAGCVLLRFGVESGSTRVLNLLQKSRRMIDWNKKTKEVFDCARRLDISTHALLIIGSPTETEKEIEETFNLTKELMPDMMQIHFFNPYPGSKSYVNLKDRLTEGDVLDMHHYNNPRLNFSAVDIQRLGQIRYDFYKRMLLNPRFFFRHISKYFLFYAKNLDIFYRLSKGVLSLH